MVEVMGDVGGTEAAYEITSHQISTDIKAVYIYRRSRSIYLTVSKYNTVTKF